MDDGECRKFGKEHLHDVEGTSAQADFADYFRECAEKATDKEERRTDLDLALERLREMAANVPPGDSVDDEADLLEMLADAEKAAGNAEEAKRTHENRLKLLEGAAKQAV